MMVKEASSEQFPQFKLENQLCFPLYAAAREITKAYTPFLKPHGLTYTQYLVFLVLWERNSVTVGEIGQKLHLDNGTLTPLLKKMEQEGWLKRRRDKEDERRVTITLLPKAYDLREKLQTLPQQMACNIKLEPSEAARLYQLLYKILEI